MTSLTVTLGYTIFTTGILGMAANIIQVILISHDKKQRNLVFGLAVLSLSVADLLASATYCLQGVISFIVIPRAVDLISPLDRL